jgi:hypothetical protein
MKFKTLKLICTAFLLTSCTTIYDKKASIEAFKQSVTYSCISEGMQNKKYDSIVLKNDASFSYDGLMGSNFYKIDSIGRSEGKKIPRTPLEDLGKKKIIHSHCLQFYKSKELDEIAKKWYKNKL